jgi:hypothetical protein
VSTTGPASPRSRPNPDAIAQRLGEEMVLVHLKTDRVFTLNRTGARIWELLSDGHDRAGIERQLLQEFDGRPAEIARDVGALLEALEAEQFLLSTDGG